MAADRAIFQDDGGRGWLVEILYGHPAPSEKGIFAARFVCPEDPGEQARVGYIYQAMLEPGNEAALLEALQESEPARSIG